MEPPLISTSSSDHGGICVDVGVGDGGGHTYRAGRGGRGRPLLVPKCGMCDKVFSSRQSKYHHMKKNVCNRKLSELETEVGALKLKLNEMTAAAAAAAAAASSASPKTVHTTNNGTINKVTNNVTNNIRVSFGYEDMAALSQEDKHMILNNGFNSLMKLIETVHLSDKYRQYQNVSIPNLKDKYAKCYDDSVNTFVTKTKSELIEEIISYRTSNLKEIHSECSRNTKLHNNVLNLIQKLESYHPEDDNDEVYSFYKDLRRDIMLLFYNRSKVFKKVGGSSC